MALKETPLCNFGWQAPNFDLIDTEGQRHTLKSLMGENGLVIVFGCNHCPYVKAIMDMLVADSNALAAMHIRLVMINSNDTIAYPDDSYDNMQALHRTQALPFPYLWDEDQSVARAYEAVCTPDFFGLDRDGTLQYRGRLDSAGRNANPDAKRDLVEAMRVMIETGRGPAEQFASMGCSIKWKAS